MGFSGPVALEPAVRSRAHHGIWGDRIFRYLVFAVAIAVVLLIVLFLYVLFRGSVPSFQAFGWEFFISSEWNSVALKFGALPFIYGTVVTAIIAMLLGVPVSLGIAIFLTELSPGWLRSPLTFIVELLAAVPSVIYGLWAFAVLAPVMAHYIEPAIQTVVFWQVNGFAPLFFLQPLFAGVPLGTDKLTAGVILAIMIIPTVTAISRESFAQVPQNQREAALSLGATQWETTRVAVLSYARTGIFAAAILGLGRAIGETMAVTMTIGNSNTITTSLLEPGQTIPSLIANSWAEAEGVQLQVSSLLELALILLLVSLLINVVARLMIRRLVPGGGRE